MFMVIKSATKEKVRQFESRIIMNQGIKMIYRVAGYSEPEKITRKLEILLKPNDNLTSWISLKTWRYLHI
jgi:hypothetical protein